MDAKELLSITKKNAISVEKILESCKGSAENGGFQMGFPTYLSTETISELGRKGFKVSEVVTHFGNTEYVVSWK